ncbi:S8 family serine peptidase [Virgibacillus halodenitrificans]|uniref:S8 family serine peptidase n=1 Tax=Virgibacillus halodenitrificans TaxID=1482 RepID=UPI000A3FB06E
MRHIFLVLILTIIIAFSIQLPQAASKEEELQSVIIEVEGDPLEHKKYIKTYHPFVKVVETYDTLFKGLALQAQEKDLEKMESLEFIKNIHGVQTYEAISITEKNADQHAVLPSAINHTGYTGKGVKVGVIDTGIDYTHPDLKKNYQQGYDLVDLDEDPMETLPEEGLPTLHGTHVAGIIAADGELKGVAPNAEIYAYRLLVQVEVVPLYK